MGKNSGLGPNQALNLFVVIKFFSIYRQKDVKKDYKPANFVRFIKNPS